MDTVTKTLKNYVVVDHYREPLVFLFTGKKEAPLTKKERKAHRLLSKTNDATMWGHSIRNTLATGSRAAFRELICELKSQAEDAPAIMKSIIGEDCYDALSEL